MFKIELTFNSGRSLHSRQGKTKIDETGFALFELYYIFKSVSMCYLPYCSFRLEYPTTELM
jgi:hypothetical protein